MKTGTGLHVEQKVDAVIQNRAKQCVSVVILVYRDMHAREAFPRVLFQRDVSRD